MAKRTFASRTFASRTFASRTWAGGDAAPVVVDTSAGGGDLYPPPGWSESEWLRHLKGLGKKKRRRRSLLLLDEDLELLTPR